MTQNKKQVDLLMQMNEALTTMWQAFCSVTKVDDWSAIEQFMDAKEEAHRCLSLWAKEKDRRETDVNTDVSGKQIYDTWKNKPDLN